jgi:hypothetical protein
MFSDAKVLISLHIPILFADYLTDSYLSQDLKGSTLCLFYANSWFIRFFFLSLPREQKDYDYDADISDIERGCDNAACTQGH